MLPAVFLDWSNSAPTVEGTHNGHHLGQPKREQACWNQHFRLHGRLAGDDTIEAGAGRDLILAGEGNDTVSAGDGDDTVDGGSGSDVIDGGVGRDVLFGGAGADAVNGGADDDTIVGGSGADRLDGGDGVDTVIYLTSSAAVKVDLAAGTGVGGDAAGDQLSLIENVTGSIFSDLLVGNDQDNHLVGAFGSDALAGGAGNDVLDGGHGADVISDGSGADFIDSSSGKDSINLANDATTDRIDLNPGCGGDTITGFDTSAVPGSGDLLDISDLIDYADPTPSLAEAIADGFVNFAGGANVAVQVDGDGLLNGSSFTTIAILTGVAQATAATDLADNIVLA